MNWHIYSDKITYRKSDHEKISKDDFLTFKIYFSDQK